MMLQLTLKEVTRFTYSVSFFNFIFYFGIGIGLSILRNREGSLLSSNKSWEEGKNFDDHNSFLNLGVDFSNSNSSLFNGNNGSYSLLPSVNSSPINKNNGINNSNIQYLPLNHSSSSSVLGSVGNSFLNSVSSLSLASGNQYQNSFEINDGDEFGSTIRILKLSISNFLKDDMGYLICKGSLLSTRGLTNDVIIRAWRKFTPSYPDSSLLHNEIKKLRNLANKSIHISRILHLDAIDISSSANSQSNSMIDLSCIISEFSEHGHLDKFMQNYVLQSSNQGFNLIDLQIMCVQLIDSLMLCHESNIKHRDIRPRNILVTNCFDKYYTGQFAKNLILKFSNFVPLSMLNQRNIDSVSSEFNIIADIDKWVAPEVDIEMRKTGLNFHEASDIWSLGLIIYYLATGGQTPFESRKQVCDANISSELRRSCLEKHGLHNRNPVLFDLIERLVRPVINRTELKAIRCHPFLWSIENKKSLVSGFASSIIRSSSESVQSFANGVEKYSSQYVFGSNGWVVQMNPQLVSLVQPAKLVSDYWRSGTYLLMAIKNQLACPQLLQSVYPHMTSNQASVAYIKQITEINFPRLLILLFELGGIHGKWNWDGEISHLWN
jgi:serine/threonine protein kinase